MKFFRSLASHQKTDPRPSRRRPPAKPYSARSVLIVFILISFSAAGIAGLARAAVSEALPGTGVFRRISSLMSGLFPNSSRRRVSLSKEYVYSDSRLLAVEDVGARQTPPSDLAVFRPSTGEWLVIDTNSQHVTRLEWGAPGDIPIEGDFDGDGISDLAVFRGSSSTWWILESGAGSVRAIQFGVEGDLPVAGDYDGDGMTDLAVFRPTSGVWYAIGSKEGNFLTIPFGSISDRPAPADYDGDGKTDPAIWRSVSGTFEWIQSSNGTVGSERFSSGVGDPVPADFDGDGMADPAIRTGKVWTIRKSLSREIISVQWHQGDIPVQSDFDGDGRADIAIWRSEDGRWLIRNSSDTTTREAIWGEPGDIPVHFFYRR
ncbi:MAG: VCBS repeat-containing protein [Acidobacteria bacterium]|nr:MAG: VCBS repeat-containing protein [Acidobacteriota bacterium]REJ98873.1 MAG: VCBS repeat-containing protein [Acidobacteriota bacterium]REK16407.1 MAG: VCBS repeat-containing protein [Acidobacteriota bacterium]REK44088.1 MAG: VCBS repeat-containing protein [Acidobacteriota bacterium]